MITTLIEVASAETYVCWDEPVYLCTLPPAAGTTDQAEDLYITEVNLSVKVHEGSHLSQGLRDGDLVVVKGTYGGKRPTRYSVPVSELPQDILDVLNDAHLRTEERLSAVVREAV